MKKLKLTALIFAVSLILCSCSAGEFFASLGFDTHDYDGEKTIKTYEADSETAKKLSESVKLLTVESADIPEFDGTKDAAKVCRDSVLNYMYSSNYAKYTGNIELLDKAGEAYPQMRFSVIIPADDFVNTFYKYFGGKEKVRNKSGSMFEYLSKTDAYTTAARPIDNTVSVTVDELTETVSTYRFSFTAKTENEDAKSYFALIIKRDDGSFYFKEVHARKRS